MNLRGGALTILLTAAVAGCSVSDIDRTYGRRRGTAGGSSVNGTSVLAGMFKQAGHRVSSWRRLSPKLQEAQVIVWFPDSFQPPTLERREFLESWLAGDSGRTLVYVGRDYDAAITYWRAIQPSVPPAQALELDRRLATVQAEHNADRAKMPDNEFCDWFNWRGDAPRRQVASLQGAWSDGIAAEGLEIEIAARLEMPGEDQTAVWSKRGLDPVTCERLLHAEEDTLVFRISGPAWEGSQLIVVNNGSFLLNLPLVKHQHRKLAGKLVSACGPATKVVFLESGPGGPPVLDEEPNEAYPTGLEVFTVWPLGVIVLHLTALGILCCFAVFPIFGRPRELYDTSYKVNHAASAPSLATGELQVVLTSQATGSPRVVRAHFGKHIEALGELLELAGDREHAIRRVRYYHEHVKRDSGTSHRARNEERNDK